MCLKTVRLIEPSVELESEFMALVQEFVAAGGYQRWGYELVIEDGNFGKYVRDRLDWKEGKNLPEGWVPGSTFWLVRGDNVIVGTSSLRHRLTEHLRNIGGHIGFNIRPSERGKGYGTAILALTLEKAKELGLKRVLVTCDDNNIASAKVIEKNGGILEDKYSNDKLEQHKRRYWIEL
jgi:predicted acetyltransferase